MREISLRLGKPRRDIATIFLALMIVLCPASTLAQCVHYSDYLHPRGHLSLNGFDIQVSGSIAYVGTPYGLQRVDVSNPDAPATADSFQANDYGYGVTLTGDKIFLSEGSSGFQIIDVSDPGLMTVLGSVNTDSLGFVSGIRVNGSLAYVAGGNQGLHIFNVDDPAQPVLINTVSIPGFAHDFQISGNFAYVANGTSLQVVDISDPLSAIIVGHIDLSTVAGSVTLFENYALVGNIRGVGNPSGDKLFVVDIASPANPAIVDTVSVQSFSATVGQNLYVTNRSGIRTFDMSTPASPAFLGAFDWHGGATNLAVGNGLVFLISHEALQIVDVTNPRPVDTNGRLRVPGDSDFGFGVSVTGDVACVATDSAFATIDISNPALPSKLGEVTGAQFTDVIAHGDTAFVVGFSFFKIYDISEPSTPQLIGSIDINAAPMSLAISGSLAFIAAYAGGLMIIDFSDPSSPVVAGTARIGINLDVAVSGHYAYLTSTTMHGVSVVDVSNPYSPDEVGGIEMLGVPYAITVRDSHAFVVGNASFIVLDITNPALPSLISKINLPDTAPHGIVLDGSYAYVTGYESGLQLIDISVPALPRVLGSSLTPMSSGPLTVAQALAVSGMYVYVLGGSAFEDNSNFWVLPAQCSSPVAIGPTSFQAMAEAEGIRVSWAGQDETVYEYHLDRATEDGPFAPLTRHGIHFGEPTSFLDRDVRAGVTYSYRLEVLDRTGRRSFIGPISARYAGERTRLFASYPNPSTGKAATIDFTLAQRIRAQLGIFDVSGRIIRVLLDETLDAGPHSAVWDGRNTLGELVPPGVYFYRLNAGSFSQATAIVRINR